MAISNERLFSANVQTAMPKAYVPLTAAWRSSPITRTAGLGHLLHKVFSIGSYLTLEQVQQKILYDRVHSMNRSVPLNYNFLTLDTFNHRDQYVHNETLPDNMY